jgi:hypothetical protein
MFAANMPRIPDKEIPEIGLMVGWTVLSGNSVAKATK